MPNDYHQLIRKAWLYGSIDVQPMLKTIPKPQALIDTSSAIQQRFGVKARRAYRRSVLRITMFCKKMMKPDKFVNEIALDKRKLISLAEECWDSYSRARKRYYDIFCVEHFAEKPSEEWDAFNRTLARDLEKPLRSSLINKFSDELKVFDFLALRLEDQRRPLTDGIYTIDNQWMNWDADPQSKFRASYADMDFSVDVITGRSYEGGDAQIKDCITDLFTSYLLDEVIIYEFRLKHVQRSQSMDSINEALRRFYDRIQGDLGLPLMDSPSNRVWVTSIEGAVATEHHTSFDDETNVYSLSVNLEIKRPLAFRDHIFGNLLSKMIQIKKEKNPKDSFE